MLAFATKPEATSQAASARPAVPGRAPSARDSGRIPLYATALGVIQTRRRAGERAPEVPPIVHEVLQSPGAALDPAVRASVEPRFGRDFGQVRIHADARAAESAAALDAAAYTVGSDVVFGRGRFAADTPEGSRLLAHELAHVVQQSGSRPDEPLSVAPADSAAEREADAAAGTVLAHGTGTALRPPSTRASLGLTRAPAGVQRQPQTKTKTKYPAVVDLTVKTKPMDSSRPELVSTVRVSVASAAEEKEAREIINDLQFRYEVTFNSQKSLGAVESDIKGDPMDKPQTMSEFLSNAPQRPLKDVITTSVWDLPQLRALKEAMAFFDPKIGGFDRAFAGNTFGRVNVGINDAGDARDLSVLGQRHGVQKTITLFDAAATSPTQLQDQSKAIVGTFVHELAHALMGSVDTYIAAMSPPFWSDKTTPTGNAGAEAPVTPYGHKNASEDLAEATKFYFLEPATLKTKCPQRFRYIDKQVKAWKGPSPSPAPSPSP